MVSNIFYFHPYLGKIPILINIFRWVETTNQFWMCVVFRFKTSVVKVSFTLRKQDVAALWFLKYFKDEQIPKWSILPKAPLFFEGCISKIDKVSTFPFVNANSTLEEWGFSVKIPVL